MLPAIVSSFHGFQGPGEALATAIDVTVVRYTCKCRHPGQCNIDLAGRAANLELAGFLVNTFGQVVLVYDAREGPPGIQVRHDNTRADFVAVLEHDTDSLAIFDQYLLYAGVGPKLATVLPHCTGKGF